MKKKLNPYEHYVAWLEHQNEVFGPFTIEIKNDKGVYEVYKESRNGQDIRTHTFNSEGNPLYFENSAGFWAEWKYDEKGTPVGSVNSRGEEESYANGRPKDWWMC
jgi:hypothetical protein